MNVKLSSTKMNGLYTILEKGLPLCISSGIESKLYAELVDRVKEKIRAKLRKGLKAEYSISMSSIEAKGLYCWFNQNFDHLKRYFQFEILILQSICMEVHRENV